MSTGGSRRRFAGVAVIVVALALVTPVPALAIVGGEEVPVGSYPSAVYLSNGSELPMCGGVLVGPGAVLTAAHCTFDTAQAELRVVAHRQHPAGRDGATRSVARIWRHPAYHPYDGGPSSGNNDIAVLTLDRALPYPAAKLAGDADRDHYRPGAMATVLGWGRLADGGARSDTLRGAAIPVTDDRSCAATYPSFKPGLVVCAGDPRGGKDACLGDSGGPLVAGNVVIGIVAAGIGCGQPGTPGSYTRVSGYLADITAHSGSDA
ncbi:serine protease [Amycolatopsis minnesotensis]|uniref:Serine protease n=1 Tax=Amycolatopsis minnesotensis TaxID=337894 RepID=A0ABP5E416_9PSEU